MHHNKGNDKPFFGHNPCGAFSIIFSLKPKREIGFHYTAFHQQRKILFTRKRTRDKILEFFSREVQLSPHLCQKIRRIFLKTVAHERMNTGDLPVFHEIKQFMVGIFYLKPFFE